MTLANADPVAVEPLYHSPVGLYQFQAEGVAYALMRRDNLYVYDTGIGKTHIGMATAALLFEDGLIDHVIVVCEKNKLAEWGADLETYTRLSHRLYRGAPEARRKMLLAPPQVLVGTYETIRNDAGQYVEVPKRKRKKLVPSFFCESLTGKRVLVIYDEMTKLGNRSSDNHKHHALMIEHIRTFGDCRVMGLTATPIENGPENYYNLGRILCPAAVGTVAQFEHEHVESYDAYGKAVKFKNLDRLAARMNGVMLRKRKTDPDVVDQFPQKVEEVTYIDLGKNHLDFYRTVDRLFGGDDDVSLFTVLRQIAGHPMSLMTSEGTTAQAIARTVGEEGLRALGAPKLDRLVTYLEPLVKGQGAQVVVFTFFGQSVLPLIADRLEEEGYSVAVNHGGLGDRAREEAKARFRSGGAGVFLTSDAGQRGINLPEASYVVHYELPLTYASYVQRSDRIHRIDSKHPSVTVMSFVTRATVEDAISGLVLKRNEWSDALIDTQADEAGFVSAAHRREMIKAARLMQG